MAISLHGCRVLIVEDEPMVGMMIEDMLRDRGYAIAGVAPNLPVALELASSLELDVAMLDVNLAGERSFAVADVLRQRHIPFIFATGYGSPGVDPSFAGVKVLHKPFAGADLDAALHDALRVA
ncbi:MAG TPA: response regulator [Pinirhizobacter sp.]|uniref:response regulator n=1 Tax=Pinirhizobacter sp. TaxID=2950432 RepID=UPI002C868BF6|nr:response regulator [Pinirhizobacter sp.]HMH69323.1 response regulator [Pinirhizobacter sp.]